MSGSPELHDKKLELEIELLAQQLAEQKKEKKKSRGQSFNEWIKQWSVTILTFTSVIGGVWGLIIPIKTYFDEESKRLKYQLNGQMVSLVNDLNIEENMDESIMKRDQAIMMLQYYEMNAFDILMFKVDIAKNEALLKSIADAFSSIYEKGHRDLLTELFDRIEDTLDKPLFELVDGEAVVEEPVLDALLNSTQVLLYIDVTPKDREKIQEFAGRMESKVPTHEAFDLLKENFMALKLK